VIVNREIVQFFAALIVREVPGRHREDAALVIRAREIMARKNSFDYVDLADLLREAMKDEK
jgi:hypothetical protein